MCMADFVLFTPSKIYFTSLYACAHTYPFIHPYAVLAHTRAHPVIICPHHVADIVYVSMHTHIHVHAYIIGLLF